MIPGPPAMVLAWQVAMVVAFVAVDLWPGRHQCSVPLYQKICVVLPWAMIMVQSPINPIGR